MPRLTTKYTKMRLFLLVLSFIVVTAVEPRCDPETQHEKDGRCCKMCGPGTRMSSTATCEEPQCVECDEHEYQDSYTIETKCQRQPYCDPNKNFEPAGHESKKKQTTCRCKLSFHCTSQACITCTQHTVCPPGEGATIIGNHLHDTKCEKCPPGMFSNESSWDGVCQKLTECGDDSNTIQAGTSMSDTICEKKSRTYGVGIGIAVAVIVVLIAAFVAYRVCFKPHAERKFKDDIKKCCGAQKEQLTNVDVIANPTEEESILIEGPIVSTPEENEDDFGSLEESLGVSVTVNGHPVKQDTKAEQLSQEETQCT